MKRNRLVLFASVISLAFCATQAKGQWVQTSGPGSAIVQCFAVNGTNLFAGSNVGGIFRSTDSGISWSAANTGLMDSDVHALAVIGANLLAGTYNGVFSSTDNGTSWAAAGLPHSQVTALLVSGTNLFAATYGSGIFRSTNNGGSWTAVNTGLTDAFVYALLAKGASLFAGTGYRGGGVFLSTDSGTNWAAVNYGLTNAYVWSLALSGANLFAGTDGGVFLSTNDGTSWTATGLTNPLVHGFAEWDSFLFAGTWGDGVLLSTNNGKSWNSVDTGLTNTNILAIVGSSTNLFAGSSGSGVWRRPLSEMIPSSAVAEQSKAPESAARAYPNPFSGKTTVRFTTVERGPVQVSVLNLLGVEVARLFGGELDAGEHSFEWDAKDAVAGTYFCIVRSNGGAERVAILLAK